MVRSNGHVTIHMATSLDGFIARKDGRVDWMETTDEFRAGKELSSAAVETFLDGIDCYVMGSRTYETALDFEAKGFGWAYGDKPTVVLTHRSLPKSRDTVEFYCGDLSELINQQLNSRFRSILVAGGGSVAGECLRLGLADEISCSILPVVIGEGIAFFDGLNRDVPLHLLEVNAYKSGMVEMRYAVITPKQ